MAAEARRLGLMVLTGRCVDQQGAPPYLPTMTYGFLVGELIHRVDGRAASEFFREEIAEKVGADFQVRLSSTAELARMAFPRVPEGAFQEDGLAGKILNAIDMSDVMSWERVSAESPGSGGHGNGRSVARVCAIIANGGELDGVRFLSEKTVQEAGKEQAYGQCPYIGWMKLARLRARQQGVSGAFADQHALGWLWWIMGVHGSALSRECRLCTEQLDPAGALFDADQSGKRSPAGPDHDSTRSSASRALTSGGRAAGTHCLPRQTQTRDRLTILH